MVQIKGIITKITNVTIHGKLLIYVKSNNELISVLAKRSLVSKNMPCTITGEYSYKYFVAENIELNFFNPQIYAKYLSSKATKTGIGLKTITKITTTYDSKIISMSKEELRENIVNDFKNINIAKLDAFLDAIYGQSTIALIEDYFSDFSLDYDVLEKIDEEYGIDAVKNFKANPYKECLNFKIQLKIADYLAKDEGVKALSDIRIDGYINYVLTQNENNGHTYMDAKDLATKVLRIINNKIVYKEDCFAIHIANRAIKNNKDFKILNDGKVFLKNTFINEKVVAERLLTLNSLFTSNITISDSDIVLAENKLNTHLGLEQRNALKMLESHGVLVLTGGPGVGKTTTINIIAEIYHKKVPSGVIKYCAPTGRAAKRLSEAVNDEAVTVHKLVELQPFEKETCAKKCAANPIEADFIIIDEVSMLDVKIAATLLCAIKNGTRVLLVGDEHQLPSVGAGNLLHDIIASNKFDVYRLTENFRQKGSGSIIDNANLIKQGKMPIANDTDFKVFNFCDEKEAKAFLKEQFSLNYNADEPFNMQVIEPTNKEVYATNKWVHDNIINDFANKKETFINTFIRVGLNDKIMFRINKYEQTTNDLLYANGEMGLVSFIDDDEIVITDSNGVTNKVLPADVTNDMSLAFSCTIHKFQGSESSLIIIYLPAAASVMMTRSLLYTAVTRAKDKVMIVSVDESLKKCVKNKGEKRKTYLNNLLAI